MEEKSLKEQVRECLEEYQKTLDKMGIKRKVGPYEDIQLARALQSYGFEMVKLAVKGARFEPQIEHFEPSKFVSLQRILNIKNIERFANLGASGPQSKWAKVRD